MIDVLMKMMVRQGRPPTYMVFGGPQHRISYYISLIGYILVWLHYYQQNLF